MNEQNGKNAFMRVVNNPTRPAERQGPSESSEHVQGTGSRYQQKTSSPALQQEAGRSPHRLLSPGQENLEEDTDYNSIEIEQPINK